MKSDEKHPLSDLTDQVTQTLVRLGYSATQGKRMLANKIVVRNVSNDAHGGRIRSIIKRESGLSVYIDTRVGAMYVFTIESSRRSREDDVDPVTHDALEEERRKNEDYDGRGDDAPSAGDGEQGDA